MPTDQLTVLIPAESTAAVAARAPAAAATELVTRVRAELPHLADLGQREELLAAAWLMSLRSARTRRAYAGDLRAWLAWLDERGVDMLAAGRVHADLWVAGQLGQGAEAASVRRRLSALSSFYRYCAAHDLVGRIPTVGVARPVVDPDYTATVGLARDEARALVAAADADRGRQALRTAAVIPLLHNALRVDEACAANVADLGADAGHRVLRGDPQRRPEGEGSADPGDRGRARRLPSRPRHPGRAQQRGRTVRAPAGHRLWWAAPAGSPMGAGTPPRPGRRRRDMAETVASLAAPLGDHLRP